VAEEEDVVELEVVLDEVLGVDVLEVVDCMLVVVDLAP
jgi:hypothetical protein